jgi:deoxyribodipyrimidine photolyase
MHWLRLTDDSQIRRTRLHPGNLGAGSQHATTAFEPDNGTRACHLFIAWFRDELRLSDHPALHAASRTGAQRAVNGDGPHRLPLTPRRNPLSLSLRQTLGDDMDDEKSVLEQMTDAMSSAAGATKEAAKTAVKKVKKAAKKVAKKVTPKKAKKAKKAAKKSSPKKSAKKAGKKAVKKKKKARKSRR